MYYYYRWFIIIDDLLYSIKVMVYYYYMEKPTMTHRNRCKLTHMQPMVLVHLPTKLGDLWGK